MKAAESVAPGADTITFDDVVAGIDLTPRCEMADCEQGNPEATHVKLLWFYCHKAQVFQCEPCANKQLDLIAKWSTEGRGDQAWKCRKHATITHAPLPAICEVRRL